MEIYDIHLAFIDIGQPISGHWELKTIYRQLTRYQDLYVGEQQKNCGGGRWKDGPLLYGSRNLAEMMIYLLIYIYRSQKR